MWGLLKGRIPFGGEQPKTGKRGREWAPLFLGKTGKMVDRKTIGNRFEILIREEYRSG